MISNSIDQSRVIKAGQSNGWDRLESRNTGFTALDAVVTRTGGEWHGLAIAAPEDATLEEWARLAKLDVWKIVMRKMYMPTPSYRSQTDNEDVTWVARPDLIEVPNARAIVRRGPGDYEETFGVASKGYAPVQPQQQIELIRRFMEAGDTKLNTMGSLYAGRKVWVLLDLGVSWRVNGTDEVRGMLFVSNANDGTGAFRVKLVLERVVCRNSYRRVGKEKDAQVDVAMTHRTVWTDTTATGIMEATKLAREQFQQEQAVAERLAATHLTEEQAFEYVARVSGSADAFAAITGKPVAEIDGGQVLSQIMDTTEMAQDLGQTMVDPSKLNRIGKRVLDVMLAGSPGSKGLTKDGISAWDAFNHLTYYATHDGRIARSASRRVESSLNGAADELKARGARVLLSMAAQA